MLGIPASRRTLALGVALAMLATGTARAGDGGVGSGTLIPTGASTAPTGIAAGDFDGDGDLDLAAANQASDNITIATSNPANRTFTLQAFVAAGDGPEAIAVADFNNDGEDDLVVANTLAGTIRVALGGAGASFTPLTPVAVGNFPKSVAVGDFNFDGHVDVAVANTSDHAIAIMLGAGTGALTLNGTVPTGLYPRTVAVGDFNRDGDDDLAVGYRGADNSITAGGVAIHVGSTGGSFQTVAGLSANGVVYGVQVGDFNQDGDEDIVYTRATTAQGCNQADYCTTVNGAVAAGGAGATFTPVGGTSNPFIYRPGTDVEDPVNFALGDLYSDGVPDLVANGWSSATAIGTGITGSQVAAFSHRQSLNIGGRGLPAFGDFDSDGNADFAYSVRNVTQIGDNGILPWYGTGDPALAGNLLTNGGFEGPGALSLYTQSPPPIPGWQRTGGATFQRYGIHPNWGTPTQLDAPNYQSGGTSMLWGGNSAGAPEPFQTTAFQTVDVPLTAATIDAGLATAHLSAWLGGAKSFPDAMSATASFRTAADAELDALTIGPVTTADRGGVTKLLRRAGSKALPAGTRKIRVTLRSFDNDQYSGAIADNVKLTVSSTDDDGDGVGNGTDNCTSVANGDQANLDGDALGDACDPDDDGDGDADGADNCPTVANGDQANLDGDALGDACDPDDDGDGDADGADNCPTVANGDQANLDGDALGDACDPDDDGDGDADGADNCPTVANGDQANLDGDALGDACDPDDDGDGDNDGADNCPTVANGDQANVDGDALGDACDPDDDGDGDADGADNCPTVANGDQANLDGDPLGDACDPDDDGDGDADGADNCPTVANGDQANLDGDALGDACDPDDDGDGDADGADNCPTVANGDQANVDGDAVGDACDADDDGDGVADGGDNCASAANPEQADLDVDGLGDACDGDDDGDQVADPADNCARLTNANQADLDGDLTGDACDADDDGDGVVDAADACPTQPSLTADGCPSPLGGGQTPSPTSPAGTTPPPGTTDPPDTTPPSLSVTVPRKLKLKALLAKGVALKSICGEPCTVEVAVRIPASLARRLKLKTLLTTAGGGTALTVKLPAKARRKLRSLRRFTLTLTIEATDAAGNPASLTRSVSVTR